MQPRRLSNRLSLMGVGAAANRAALSVAVLCLVAEADAYAQSQAVACDSSKIYCHAASLYPVWEYDVLFLAGKTYDITTSNIVPIAGTPVVNADTVLWLVDRTNDRLVEVDNNGNTLTTSSTGEPGWQSDSGIFSYVPTSNFNGRVVVASSSHTRYGEMDVSILRDSVELVPASRRLGVPFGGTWVKSDVRTGDWLHVGALTDGELFANTAYLFGNDSFDCSSNCGPAQTSRNLGPIGPYGPIPGLSTIESDNTDSTSLFLYGSSLLTTPVHARFFHRRIEMADGGRWSGSQYLDRDGDGLTWELEAIVGTCDSTAGPSVDCDVCYDSFPTGCPAGGCRCFGDRQPLLPAATPPYTMADVQFDASDTDHDGVSDFEELFGKSLICSTSISPALGLAPTGCTNVSTEMCPAGPCDPYSVPYSALGADPREFDVWVEIDALLRPLPLTTNFLLGSTSAGIVSWIYENEGRECPGMTNGGYTDCPADLSYYNRVSLHLYDDDIIPERIVMGTMDSYAARTLRATGGLTPSRRVTGDFRYALAPDGAGGGQTDGRNFTFGSPKDDVFAHELGHTLSLEHGGDISTNGKFSYMSLMNDSRYQMFPVKSTTSNSLWEPLVGASCTSSAQCGNGVCIPDPNNPPNSVCAIQCNGSANAGSRRLSRGSGVPMHEFAVPEVLNIASWAASDPNVRVRDYSAYVACGADGPNLVTCATTPPAPPAPFSSPAVSCTTTDCWVDHDYDGLPTPFFIFAPLDFADNPAEDCTVAEVVTDFDDWKGIYREAVNYWLGEPDGNLFVHLANFQSDFQDYIFFPKSSVTLGSPTFGPSINDTAITMDNGAEFDGPQHGGPDGFYYVATDQMDSLGKTIDGRSPTGFMVEFVFRVDQFSVVPHDHILIQSNLLTVRVDGTSQRVEVSIHDGSSWQTLQNAMTITAGQWHKIHVLWYRTDPSDLTGSSTNNLFVDVVPYVANVGFFTPFRQCDSADVDAVSERAVGSLWMGFDPQSASDGLDGMVDFLTVYNFPRLNSINGKDMSDLLAVCP